MNWYLIGSCKLVAFATHVLRTSLNLFELISMSEHRGVGATRDLRQARSSNGEKTSMSNHINCIEFVFWRTMNSLVCHHTVVLERPEMAVSESFQFLNTLMLCRNRFFSQLFQFILKNLGIGQRENMPNYWPGPRTAGFFRGVENFQAVFVACLNVFGTKSLPARLHNGVHAELRGALTALYFCRLVAWIPLWKF